jgi:hypothetical protein
MSEPQNRQPLKVYSFSEHREKFPEQYVTAEEYKRIFNRFLPSTKPIKVEETNE